jgi:hypothetical protein
MPAKERMRCHTSELDKLAGYTVSGYQLPSMSFVLAELMHLQASE